MATREEATLSANSNRMKRNHDRMASDDAYNKGKKIPQIRFSRLEQIKELPRGKAAQETWRPSKRKASGR